MKNSYLQICFSDATRFLDELNVRILGLIRHFIVTIANHRAKIDAFAIFCIISCGKRREQRPSFYQPIRFQYWWHLTNHRQVCQSRSMSTFYWQQLTTAVLGLQLFGSFKKSLCCPTKFLINHQLILRSHFRPPKNCCH